MGEKCIRNILSNFWTVNWFYEDMKLHIWILVKMGFFWNYFFLSQPVSSNTKEI